VQRRVEQDIRAKQSKFVELYFSLFLRLRNDLYCVGWGRYTLLTHFYAVDLIAMLCSQSELIVLLFVSDHADVLQRVRDKVVRKLDAQSVARNMFQSFAITARELESIQCVKDDEPTRAAERLLRIVMKQSDFTYGCFLDALKANDQRPIYDVIVSGTYQGQPTTFIVHVLSFIAQLKLAQMEQPTLGLCLVSQKRPKINLLEYNR